MNPIDRALWYVERHFGSELTLEEIAAHAQVTPHHLTRAFAGVTGRSLMRYVRGRRLTEAARRLANGAPDILALAVEAGYGSHEAFTRAFRDRFGVTPETVRAERRIDQLELVEPIKMQQQLTTLAPPRFENGKTLLIAGVGERYDCESSAGIPAQWQRFMPYLRHVPHQKGNVAYGVAFNTDDEGNFDYLCGVEVASFSDLPAELARVRIPARRYAVFAHRDHIATIRSTMTTIWSKWLPESGHQLADAPSFERYGEEFDSRTGAGGFEVWIPLA